jgi:transcriptional regulator with XRE-family HTH domain
MDDARIGRALRELRRRKGLRQCDVAARARVSQGTISLIERGHVGRLSIRTMREVFSAVDAGFDSTVIWRGGALERLLDARHASLAAVAIGLLRRLGWLIAVEVSYSVYGERGSIDILAVHAATRIALVVEIKTELTSAEALGRKLDEKVRLVARHLCEERFGWKPVSVGRLVILPATNAARRKVEGNESILRALFPARGRDARAWLRAPHGPLAGLVFLADTNSGSHTRKVPGPSRVRRTTANAS